MQGGGAGDRGKSSDYRRAAAPDATEDFLFHLYRGSELLQDNRVHEAKEELEQALKLQPRDSKGQDLLAVVYFRLGLYPRAIEIYEELIGHFPRDAALTQNLALCYLKTGQPEKARTLLENLVLSQPDHLRAWSYLGLVHERLGDYQKARGAFERGQQPGMARRMADLLASAAPPRSLSVPAPAEMTTTPAGPLGAGTSPPSEAFHDLIRETTLIGLPTVPSKSPLPPPPPLPSEAKSGRPGSSPPAAPNGAQAASPGPVVPSLSSTLEVAAAPNPRPLPVGTSPEGLGPRIFATTPAAGGPVVPRVTIASPSTVEPSFTMVVGPVAGSEGASPARPRAASLDLPTLAAVTRDALLAFPARAGLSVHESGLVLARVQTSFAARLSGVHMLAADALPFKATPLPRRTRNRSLDEPLGGAEAPLFSLAGTGHLVLSPAPGERLAAFRMDGDFLFLREAVLLGFEESLAYENGRLAAFAGEAVALVQLRGTGGVVLRARRAVLTAEVKANKSVVLAREAILGWSGRLLPRELSPDEAPGGAPALISFAGEGTVLIGALAPAVAS